MLNKKEVGTIFLMALIIALTVSFLKTQILLWVFIAIFIVIVLNVIAKKIAAYYLESEVYVRPWEVERSGFKNGEFSRTNIPVGVFLPIIVSLISLGNLFWVGSMVFDVKPKVSRSSKRHGLYSFSEMTEYHLGLIAATGVIINLIAAVVGYLLGFSTFARLNIYFAFFCMIPLSDLDGNKIFFGNTVLWSFLATLVLIGIGYVFFLT